MINESTNASCNDEDMTQTWRHHNDDSIIQSMTLYYPGKDVINNEVSETLC